MRLGSTAEPFMWKISQPPKCGPLTSHSWRLPSEVRINPPLRVPTKTLTPLMIHSFRHGLSTPAHGRLPRGGILSLQNIPESGGRLKSYIPPKWLATMRYPLILEQMVYNRQWEFSG